MSGRMVRSKTAERVAELLGSREGRSHLSEHGWIRGMPVIIGQINEPVDDIMGLVSVHNCPVLVAILDNQGERLRFIHVSPPNDALEIVEETPAHQPICSLFELAEEHGMLEFRVRYWAHTAVANALPDFTPKEQVQMTMLRR